MTHPDITAAVAAAHRADLVRAAQRRTGLVVHREASRRRARLADWLKAQLHHPTAPAGVVNAPRTAWECR
ncbi:MAG TPA: hypothetical protein VFJ98_04655 [Mycobacteriales bacterium]|jgi:hypothetical protein|nr:hypothetical protein [Mycobacteriales bacterium]